MFWPAMFVFFVLAVTPVILATVLNRVHGDSLSDVDDLHPADPVDADPREERRAER